MLEVILDTETTGLSTIEKHRIVEIGCIELKDQIPTNKIFHTHINPERTISQEAQKVHGYTEKFLSDKKTFSEIVEEFLSFIKDKKIIIHNAPFDLSFLNYELSEILQAIKDKKFTHISLITGKLASRGLSVVSKDYKLHLTDQYYIPSLNVNGETLIQGLRILGCYDDKKQLNIWCPIYVYYQILNCKKIMDKYINSFENKELNNKLINSVSFNNKPLIKMTRPQIENKITWESVFDEKNNKFKFKLKI